MLNQNIYGKKFKVFNLGVCAITSKEVARHFYKNIIDYRPHLTIILVGHNDNNPIRLTLANGGNLLNHILSSAVVQLTRLKIIKLFIFSTEVLNGFIHKKLEIQKIYSDIYISYHMPNYLRWEEQDHKYNLEYMVDIASKKACKVLICNYFNSPANNFLREFAFVKNIAFCDNEKIFKAYSGLSSDLINEDGWHPSYKGYSIIAKNLYDNIIKNNLLN